MTYEPDRVAERDALEVFVEGGHGTPDRVYHLRRAGDGRVHVRLTEGALAPREHTARVDELLATFEDAYRARRRLSVDLHGIRAWLHR